MIKTTGLVKKNISVSSTDGFDAFIPEEATPPTIEDRTYHKDHWFWWFCRCLCCCTTQDTYHLDSEQKAQMDEYIARGIPPVSVEADAVFEALKHLMPAWLQFVGTMGFMMLPLGSATWALWDSNHLLNRSICNRRVQNRLRYTDANWQDNSDPYYSQEAMGSQRHMDIRELLWANWLNVFGPGFEFSGFVTSEALTQTEDCEHLSKTLLGIGLITVGVTNFIRMIRALDHLREIGRNQENLDISVTDEDIREMMRKHPQFNMTKEEFGQRIFEWTKKEIKQEKCLLWAEIIFSGTLSMGTLVGGIGEFVALPDPVAVTFAAVTTFGIGGTLKKDCCVMPKRGHTLSSAERHKHYAGYPDCQRKAIWKILYQLTRKTEIEDTIQNGNLLDLLGLSIWFEPNQPILHYGTDPNTIPLSIDLTLAAHLPQEQLKQICRYRLKNTFARLIQQRRLDKFATKILIPELRRKGKEEPEFSEKISTYIQFGENDNDVTIKWDELINTAIDAYNVDKPEESDDPTNAIFTLSELLKRLIPFQAEGIEDDADQIAKLLLNTSEKKDQNKEGPTISSMCNGAHQLTINGVWGG